VDEPSREGVHAWERRGGSEKLPVQLTASCIALLILQQFIYVSVWVAC